MKGNFKGVDEDLQDVFKPLPQCEVASKVKAMQEVIASQRKLIN
jgi:hypothetical protein